VSKAPACRGEDLISKVLLWWLLAIGASFVIGFSLLAIVPAVSGVTWGVGIVCNVSMAVGIGVFFGWTRQGLQILIAIVFGAVVTILGLDLLVLVPSPNENAHFWLLSYAAFDSFAVLVALLGMVILIGGGAIAGVVAHLALSRSGCVARSKGSPKRRNRALLCGTVRLRQVVMVRSVRPSIASP
jgi:hypothetical protein